MINGNENLKGKVVITVTLFLNQDLNDEQIQEMLSEVDYEFNHINIEETRLDGSVFPSNLINKEI